MPADYIGRALESRAPSRRVPVTPIRLDAMIAFQPEMLMVMLAISTNARRELMEIHGFRQDVIEELSITQSAEAQPAA
jgi:hypothetical protein